MTYQYAPIRMTKKKTITLTLKTITTTLNSSKDVEEQNHPYTAVGNVKWYSHSGK